jgi:hypothetical protein
LWDFSAALPALPSVQARGVAARDSIKHQQCSAGAESAALGGAEEGRTNTSTATTLMHKHLRDICAMWLILGLRPGHLNGSDNRPGRVFGGEHQAFAARQTHGDARPIRFGFGARYGKHEAYGCATFNAVNKHVAQPLNFPIIDLLKTSDLRRIRHVFISSTNANFRKPRSQHIAQPFGSGCETPWVHGAAW